MKGRGLWKEICGGFLIRSKRMPLVPFHHRIELRRAVFVGPLQQVGRRQKPPLRISDPPSPQERPLSCHHNSCGVLLGMASSHGAQREPGRTKHVWASTKTKRRSSVAPWCRRANLQSVSIGGGTGREWASARCARCARTSTIARRGEYAGRAVSGEPWTCPMTIRATGILVEGKSPAKTGDAVVERPRIGACSLR